MSRIDYITEQKLAITFAKRMGFGQYCVSSDGVFISCDEKAKKIFGIPESEKDLSKYSITNLYIDPEERDLHLMKLFENRNQPLLSTLNLRINNKDTLLFDICWLDEFDDTTRDFPGFIALIEEGTIFPQIFHNFPYGLYEVDNKNIIVRANKKIAEIFKFKDETEVIGKSMNSLYGNSSEFNKFIDKIKVNGFAHQVLKLKDSQNNELEIECFSRKIDNKLIARWGVMVDVTWSERYFRALDSMPTGYYTIEKNKFTQCNIEFAKIMGFKDKQDAINKCPDDYFLNPDEKEKYLKSLYNEEKKGLPLRDYRLILINNEKKLITVSIDAKVIRDDQNKLIGRQGTMRDITETVKLEERVVEAEQNLLRTTADINKLIHTFLHPVLKYGGNAELMKQTTEILKHSFPIEVHPGSNSVRLGERLMRKLVQAKNNLPDINENLSNVSKDDNLILTLKFRLNEIINNFDYNLRHEKSPILLKGSINDAAMLTLDVINKSNYFSNRRIKKFIGPDLLELLQGILFDYLIRGGHLLSSEIEVMKREIESLRGYIGFRKARKPYFVVYDLGTILEENIERFTPILFEENMRIDFKRSGNLTAEISPHDIDRVISNILFNAQKYSSKGNNQRFIKIRARELGNLGKIEFSVENFGIPIKKEEIAEGKIWLTGYRGELALLTDRDGTGIGLADVKDTIEAHGGEVNIKSEPVITETNSTQYKVPYRTIITIILPKKRKTGA